MVSDETVEDVCAGMEAVCAVGGALIGPGIVWGPLGLGKSEYAATAAQATSVTSWVSCRGAGVEHALRQASGLLAQADAGQHELGTVVLDDVVGVFTPESFVLIKELSSECARRNARLLITTRDVPPRGLLGDGSRFEIRGPREICIGPDDAQRIALARGVDVDRANAALSDSGGHVGLFLRLLDCDEAGRESHAGLESYLESVCQSSLEARALEVLRAAIVIGAGKLADLHACGVSADLHEVERLSEALPFVRLTGDSPSSRGFLVPQRLRMHLMGKSVESLGLGTRGLVPRVARLFADSARCDDAVRIAADYGDAGLLVDLLLRFDEGAMSLDPGTVVGALECVGLSRVMSDARLLVLGSDAALELDRFEEAVARARAARILAEHAGNHEVRSRALANELDSLRMLNCWTEALDLVRQVPVNSHGIAVTFEVAAAAGRLYMVVGAYENARTMFDLARSAAAVTPGRSAVGCMEQLELAESMLPALAEGEFSGSLVELSRVANSRHSSYARSVAALGNLAAALLESGRVERAQAIVESVYSRGTASSLAYFLPVLGCAQFAEGHEELGLATMAEGIAHALKLGAEAEAAQNRVYEAMLLRAAGRFDESLTSAERAFERLSLQDFMDFRRMAALEVAASLLAIGDSTAARAWAEPIASQGFGANLHHSFRAEMILAECDRREGDREAGVARIQAYADHLRSENSNFQAALYCRAFPHLLGMMAEVVGASGLPAHLVRMMPAEPAERCLAASRSSLPESEWSLLGQRLLGRGQFDAFVQRDGKPLCRVRLFGGLEVSVGDRAVRDRDWKKRKARTVFTMLVLRRGQELPRDQILDAVWPELPDDRAKNNFYVAWSVMKMALGGEDAASGPSPYVENKGGRCRIVRDAVRSDVDEFEEHLAAARDAEVAGNIDAAIDAYERLSVIYRAELLPGDLYDEWFAPYRERYRFEFIAAMLRMVDLQLGRDEPCEALVYARRALAVDPFREDLYQSLLRCQIAAGQRSAAIETFLQCRAQLADELGLDPSSETVALYQQILVMEERPRYDTFGLG